MVLQYSFAGSAFTTIPITGTLNTTTGYTATLSSIAALQDSTTPMTFRLYLFGSQGNYTANGIGLGGTTRDMVLRGSVVTPDEPEPDGQTPYGGSIHDLTASRLEAENYDEGGAGVAYFDTTTANRGNSYRQDAVDIQRTSDVGGGYNVGFMASGEWLEYTVSAPAGTYNIDLRVASAVSGGQIRVLLDGTELGAATVTKTGGWQNWVTVTIPNVTMPQTIRRGVLRLEFSSPSGDRYNLNWIEFRAVPETANELKLYLEAESGTGISGDWSTTVDGSPSNNAGLVWNGANQLTDPLTDKAVSYTFKAPQAGLYKLFFRVDTNNNGGDDSFWVRIAGADLTRSSNITRTDGWIKFNGIAPSNTYTWDQVHNYDGNQTAVLFYLPAGDHTLYIAGRENGTQLDQIFVTNTDQLPN